MESQQVPKTPPVERKADDANDLTRQMDWLNFKPPVPPLVRRNAIYVRRPTDCQEQKKRTN